MAKNNHPYRRGYLAITAVENCHQFFACISDIFGVVFFYQHFHNIFLALLPWISLHFIYALIVPFSTQVVGRLGVRRALTFSVIIILLSTIPAYFYYLTPTTALLVAWWISVNLFRPFYHPARVYTISRCTSYHQRGTQIAYRLISFNITSVITPIIGGFLIQQYGFPIMLIVFSGLMGLALLPIRYIPNMFFNTTLSFTPWLKRYRFRRMAYFNLIGSLGTYTNHLWVLFIFLSLGSSYQSLGFLVGFTTITAVFLMFTFGRYLNSHGRKRSFITIAYLSAATLIARALPYLPIPITDTLTRLVRQLKIEAQEVVIVDTINRQVKPHLKDEAMMFHETVISLEIGFSLLITAIIAQLWSIPISFITVALIILLLTLANPYRYRALTQANP